MKNARIAALIAAASLAFVPTAQAQKKDDAPTYSSKDLISNKAIAEKGGVMLKVEGVGLVKVLGLKSSKSRDGSCSLVVPAFTEMLSGMKLEKGVTVSVKLRSKICPKADGTSVVCCVGPGQDCVATVEVPTAEVMSPM